jgi:hypothetical protein
VKSSFLASAALSACTWAGLFSAGPARAEVAAAAEADDEAEAEAEPEKPAPGGKVRPGFERGALQQVAKGVRKLLGLAWEKKGLQLDRERHEQYGRSKEEVAKEIEERFVKMGLDKEQAAKMAERQAAQDVSGLDTIFGELRAAAGGGSSGSSRGGDHLAMHFDGGQLAGRLDVNRREFRVVLSETAGPGRQLDFRDDGDGGLSIVSYGAEADFFLRVSQKKDGAFRVTHLRGKELFQGEAESFAAFCRRHPQYAADELLPLLKHLGIVPPPMADDPRVKAEVLSRLRPLSAEEQKEFEQALKGLDDNQFTAREAASKKLAAAYGRCRTLIAATLKEGQPSPEARQRLQGIVEKNSRDFGQIDAAVTALGLLDDPGCLVGLLDEAKGADLAAVCGRLRKLSGRELPAEAAAWKKWWAEAAKPGAR